MYSFFFFFTYWSQTFEWQCVLYCCYFLAVIIFVSETDGIVSYMKKQAGPSSVSLLSEADLESFVDNYEASVVGELKL